MSTVCAEVEQQQQHQHKFHSSHQLLSPKKSPLREIDIPPRKLLTRRAVSAAHDGAGDLFTDETILHKFLPHNDSDSDSDDPYSSDHFRMYEFKVRRCTRSRSHDWTDCPFAHPGEKARRRDPRRYHYSGTVCPEYRRGGCSRGDGCEFAHGVFECWLHPARYRTEACKDGKNCKRKVCFFAHTPRQLRILPVTSSSSSHSSRELFSCNNNNKKNKLFNLNLNPVSASSSSPRSSNNNNNCCLFCHCGGANNNYNSTASPTSTLFGMSHFSPPVSPRNGVSSLNSPVSRFGYKDVLAELMGSFEGLSFNNIEGTTTTSSPSAKMGPNNNKLAWLDVVDVPNFNFEEQQQQQYIVSPSAVSNSCSSYFGCDQDQQKFILSPSTTHNQNPTTTGFSNNRFFFSNNENKVVGGGDVNAPDLGWVNELLM